MSFRPSEPTGWPLLSSTVGGHTTAVEFVVDGCHRRVALLALRRSDTLPPVVGRAFGGHYDFRVLDVAADFVVRSHSVFVAQDAAGTRFGADLHLVYEPHGDAGPPADDALHWIQVVSPSSGPAFVDNGGRANPFYPYGGRTSVDGRLVVNYQGVLAAAGDCPGFRAETFLARDTGRADATGRGIVELHGGVAWGWEARPM